MKVWITKYCLTKGIYTLEVQECIVSKDMVKEIGNSFANPFHGEGNEWHKTIESAISKAEKMKEAKIRSLEKQIKTLQELTFKTN